MRTVRLTLLALLLAATPAVVFGQPARPFGLTEKQYQKKKKEYRELIRDLEAEHARYDDGASGFEGIWTIQGNQTSRRRAGGSSRVRPFDGRLVFTPLGKGVFEIEGRVASDGHATKPWKGKGTVSADGKRLETQYEAKSFAGVGSTVYTLQADGSLHMTFIRTSEEDDDPEARGEATVTRELGALDRAQLEEKLFKTNHDLQFLRYNRPEPLAYRARSRKLKIAFTPTVEWDPNGVEQQVVEMIDAAKKSVDLCVFEFSLMRVARALVRAKQERGVTVRMVYDDREEKQPAVKLLNDNGIVTRSDKRSALMHNKFMVIDFGEPTEKVWSGSTNLSAGGIYVADNHCMTFKNHEVGVIYHTEFEEMFLDGEFGTTSPANTSHDWIKLDNVSKVQVYFAPEDDPMKRLVEIVRTAKKSIRIMAFAFTSEDLFKAIKERMESPDKVKVEGIFESRHAGWKDIKIGPLHAIGAKVRFDVNPDTLHHKVLIIDDKLVISGSFNFTDSATTENDENMIVLDSRSAARVFTREFRRIMTTTDPDDPRIATSGMEGRDAATGLVEAVEHSDDRD